MKKHFLMLTTAASILAYGTAEGRALNKIPTTRSCSSWSKRNRTRPTRLTPMHQATALMPAAALHAAMHERGRCAMGRHTMRHGGGMRGGFAMRIIFALMDPDGDGTISLEEFQAAHERIFKAIDTDKDGTVSMEEMRDFLHGAGKATLPQRSAPKD